jgi:hypothetical protein
MGQADTGQLGRPAASSNLSGDPPLSTGNPRDNAQVESFIKTLKHAEIYLHDHAALQDFKPAAFSCPLPKANSGV